MLSLNLSRIRTAHERFEQVYSREQLGGEDDGLRVAAPAKLAFDISKDNDQFRLVGQVQTVLELVCSRCLAPFTWPVDSSFDLRYQPRSRNIGADEREIEEDDLTTAFCETETIDIGQLMREQFYLSLPMKPLCQEDCRGLCGQCGTNLNGGSCNCSREWDDPRLAALTKLKAEG